MESNAEIGVGELTTLWNLSDEGRAEWWPGEVALKPYTTPDGTEVEVWFYEDDIVIKVHHILAIVWDSAETWLRGRGWKVITDSSDPCITTPYWHHPLGCPVRPAPDGSFVGAIVEETRRGT